MLYASEAFLLRCGNQIAADNERRRTVVIERGDAEDTQEGFRKVYRRTAQKPTRP